MTEPIQPNELGIEERQQNLQRPLIRAEKFLSAEEYALLVGEGDIALAIKPPQEPQEKEPRSIYIEVNTGSALLLVEDPKATVKPVFSRKLSVVGNPPKDPTRIIYVESNSSKGVEIYYPDSLGAELIKKGFSTAPPQAEYHPRPISSL